MNKSIIKRIEALEAKFMADPDQPVGIVIKAVDQSRRPGPRKRITRLSFHRGEVTRLDGEAYDDFEARALAEAKKQLSGGGIPVVIADGDVE